MSDQILHDHTGDGTDRRGFLKCMAWAGTGALWAVQGGVLRSIAVDGRMGAAVEAMKGALVFAQISDSHSGRCIPTGAGAPTMARRRSRSASGSAR